MGFLWLWFFFSSLFSYAVHNINILHCHTNKFITMFKRIVVFREYAALCDCTLLCTCYPLNTMEIQKRNYSAVISKSTHDIQEPTQYINCLLGKDIINNSAVEAKYIYAHICICTDSNVHRIPKDICVTWHRQYIYIYISHL